MGEESKSYVDNQIKKCKDDFQKAVEKLGELTELLKKVEEDHKSISEKFEKFNEDLSDIQDLKKMKQELKDFRAHHENIIEFAKGEKVLKETQQLLKEDQSFFSNKITVP